MSIPECTARRHQWQRRGNSRRPAQLDLPGASSPIGVIAVIDICWSRM